MKKPLMYLVLGTVFLSVVFTGLAHENSVTRSISVSGSAEKNIQPDRLYFVIQFGEYWKEEFEEGRTYEDFRTKVPIDGIEKDVLEELGKAGYGKEDIVVKNIGNSWRQQGKDFLVKKVIELKLKDFSEVNRLIATLRTRGIDYMNISRMESDRIEEVRLEVKAEALRAAQTKADKLAKTVGMRIGKPIKIIENESGSYNPYLEMKESSANRMMDGGMEVSDLDQLKMINVRYSISAEFEIE